MCARALQNPKKRRDFERNNDVLVLFHVAMQAMSLGAETMKGMHRNMNVDKVRLCVFIYAFEIACAIVVFCHSLRSLTPCGV